MLNMVKEIPHIYFIIQGDLYGKRNIRISRGKKTSKSKQRYTALWALKIKLFKEEQEEKNRIFEGNIKLSDSNKWLKKDLKILSKFIDTYFNDDALSDEVKRIINANKEEENEKKL